MAWIFSSIVERKIGMLIIKLIKFFVVTILGLRIKIFNTKSIIIRNKQAKEQFVFIFLA